MISIFWNNFKLISYLIIAIILAIAGWKLYNIIEDNGRYKVIIENQERAIKIKNNQIIQLRDLMKLTSDVITERDQELRELLDGDKTKDLGEDASDLAPPAYQEYFKRLEQ